MLFFTALHFTQEIPTAWAGVEGGQRGGPGSPGPRAFVESSLRTTRCPCEPGSSERDGKASLSAAQEVTQEVERQQDLLIIEAFCATSFPRKWLLIIIISVASGETEEA